MAKLGDQRTLILDPAKNKFRQAIQSFLASSSSKEKLHDYWLKVLGPKDYYSSPFSLVGIDSGGSSSVERMNSRCSDRVRKTSQNLKTSNLSSIITLKSMRKNHPRWFDLSLRDSIEKALDGKARNEKSPNLSKRAKADNLIDFDCFE